MPRFTLITLLLSATLLNGCTQLIAGGAATGVAVVHDRRSAGTVIDDQTIELKTLRAILSDEALSKRVHVNVTSYNMITLITGEAPTEELRRQVEQIARSVPKVRRVHNEIVVAAPSSLMARSSDTLITTKVKTNLLQIDHIEDFDPTRVKVVTENGTVFLMGLLKRREAEATTDVARRTSGVQRVVKIFEYLN